MSKDKLPSAPSGDIGFYLQEAKNDLLTFSQITHRGFEVVWFHEIIAAALERALENAIARKKSRIIITLPPRHGKSQLSAINFPAWALGRHPEIKFILSTYGAELSEKHGQSARDIISSEIYQAIFPGITLKEDTKAKAKWMTNKGGSFTAVGIGGAVTGIGADVILIDDPHKSREEAESETVRETVWEYYRSTLYSRLEGFGAVILIMQRWHNDDLVGRILEQQNELRASGQPHDEWEIINFPAIAEEKEEFRSIGESLWPSRFPLEVLTNIRQNGGLYNWASQYQQQPINSATQEFKESMFRYFEEADLKNKYLNFYTLVDPGISQKKTSDNTVVLTVAKEVNGPNIYRIREDAGHFTPSQTVDLIFQHQATHKSAIWLETVAYQKALKFAVEERQRKEEKYFTINELKLGTNKEIRIRGLLPLYEVGVIFHRRGDVEYEREALAFPEGRRDDRVDCMSFLLQAIENTRTSKMAKQYKPKWNGYRKSATSR